MITMQEVQASVAQYYESIDWPWLYGLSEEYAPHAAITLIVLFFVWMYHRTGVVEKDQRKRERDMAKQLLSGRDKEAFQKILIGDVVVDGVEDLVYKDKLTRDEATFWYARIGNILDLQDLLPKEQQTLKKKLLEKRKGDAQRQRLNGSKVNLPADPPDEGLLGILKQA